MKKTNIFTVLLIVWVIISCKNEEKTPQTKEETTNLEAETPPVNLQSAAFNADAIPVTISDIGVFPYFSAPESYKYTEEKTKEFEEKYFFYNDKLVQKVSGKYYHTRIFPNENVNFSETYVTNNYKQAIEKAGGVEIYSGYIPFKATNTITEEKPSYIKDLYDYQSTRYKHFFIKTQGENIWIELNYGNNANLVDFTVVTEKPLKETVETIKANEIQHQLDDSGKAVLYINFDTDKSTLRPEGQQIVDEIAKLLNDNKELKLSIEGHTDNTGSPQHNKNLSQHRAEAVLESLTSMNIEESRLKAKGFGAEKPIADNATEENKSKNRRVELIKL